MHLFHKWSQWGEVLVTYRGNKQQWRKCLVCNKAQFRTLNWDNQTRNEHVNKSLERLVK